MSLNIQDVCQKWADSAPTDFRTYGNVKPSYDGRDLYSYGSHFILARVMGDREWFLVNGDRYSVSTSRHQNEVRAAIKRTGLPSVIVPFTVLREAGIDMDSIKIVDNDPERIDKIWVPVAEEDVPEYARDEYMTDYYRRNGDSWQRATWRHWLGASVFRASYRYTDHEHTDREGRRDYPTRKGTAYFVSAFDENEPTPLYFLAQLPRGSKPTTVAEALECLKPADVVEAESRGLQVQRQGDVFAIPALTWTALLKEQGAKFGHLDYVLGVSHTVTDSATVKHGRTLDTYGKGIMRHKPREFWRRTGDHKRVKLGDGKAWYRLVKNTVPEGRSWSMGGNVD